MTTSAVGASDQQALEQLGAAHKQMKAEIGKVIVGQEQSSTSC